MQLIRVVFKLKLQTEFGEARARWLTCSCLERRGRPPADACEGPSCAQSVRLIGGHEALGGWNLARSLLLHWTPGDQWVVRHRAPRPGAPARPHTSALHSLALVPRPRGVLGAR